MGGRRKIGLLCAVLALALGVSGLAQPQLAQAARDEETDISEELQGAKESLSDAQNEVDEIEEGIKSAEERLESLESERDDLLSYIEKLDQNLTEVQDTIDSLEASMEVKQEEIAATQEKLAQAQADEREQYEAMKLRIQYMYENGSMQFLELLFRSESLTQLLNRSEYITTLVEYDRDMLKEYQQTCQEIQDTQAALEEEYSQMEELQAANEASRKDLEALMEAKNEELDDYSQQIDGAEEQVDRFAQALEEQEALIEQIEAEIRRQEEEAARKEEETDAGDSENGDDSQDGGENGSENGSGEGSDNGSDTGEGSGSGGGSGSTGFIWPIPDSTRITSEFGEREAPLEGVSNFHKGVDVGAPTGTKIYAAAAGEVVISQYNYSAGNYIMINHGNGVYTVYMHCSKLLVSVGDHVEQGDNIGLVGSTGYSTGPHLHFGVRINGEYRNPLDYVSVP